MVMFMMTGRKTIEERMHGKLRIHVIITMYKLFTS